MEKRSAEITALVERARKGDKTASAELYEKMYDKLYFFALKNVRSKDDAEDIVQEAFMKALESLSELNSSESFSGWIYSVTYNLCIDKMRGGKRVARFETEDDRDNAIENSALNEPVMVPEDYMQNEETKRQIKDVIDGLRPDMRSAVILYYYDQMSIAEIAETMNLSESSVKSKLYQARKKIKTKLEKLGVDRSVTVHMSLVPIPALIALVADELDTSAAVVASPFGKAAVTVTAGVTVLGAAAAMAFFANVHKGDMRIDSGIDSAESTVSIYTEEQSSANSLGESVLTSSLSISSMAQNNILSDSQNGAVNTDTSTQSNYDTYVNTPNNNNNNNNNNYYPPNDPQTDNTSSDSSSESSAADSSSQVEDDVFHYIWNSRELDDGGVELVKYNGSDHDITIPSTIGGKPLTTIGEDAFSDRMVDNITIPPTVTTIGAGAFRNTTISSIRIPAATTSIGGRAFPHGTHIELEDGNNSLALYDDGSLYSADGKKLMYVGADDNDYRFPDGVEEIGECAFYESKLTKISFSEGIKIIGEKAFCGSYELTSFNFPDSLTEIRANAFSSNKSEYISIILPYNTKYVGENAFGGRKFNFAVYAADAQIDESLFWDDSECHAASSLEEYKVLKDRYKNRVNIGNG